MHPTNPKVVLILCVVITGWESNAAREMLKDTGSVRAKKPVTTFCKLRRKKCTPKDMEPDFGTSHYYVPPPAVHARDLDGIDEELEIVDDDEYNYPM